MMYYVIRLILVFSLRAPDARRLTTKFNRQNRRILQVPDPIRHSPPHSSSLILRRIRYLTLRVHISTGRPDVADTVKGPLDYKAYRHSRLRPYIGPGAARMFGNFDRLTIRYSALRKKSRGCKNAASCHYLYRRIRHRIDWTTDTPNTRNTDRIGDVCVSVNFPQ